MSTFPTSVPKPVTAGAGQMAIAITKMAYANIRNGPSTNYRTVGNLRNYTLAVYYPASRTGDGWVWIEQYGVVGWVSTTVVRFEHVSAPAPVPPQMATPYDGKIGVWHWRGDSIAENTIEELAQNIKKYAPNVTQVWVKTSDYTVSSGAQWMGYWDTKRNMAIDGPASIDRWVQALGRYGLEFHAWCVPRGRDLEAETNLIIQACSRPGVKSMILDVEPYDGFWMGGAEGVRPFMTRIRRAIPGSFHIGLAVDPRTRHYDTIHPREWSPFVNSVHTMSYWETFRREPDDVLEESFRVWNTFGKPVIPILQGDAEPVDMEAAHNLATQRYGARGLSWWRVGVIGPVEWNAINRPIVPGTTPVEPPSDEIKYGEEQIVKPNDPGFSRFSHTGQNELQSFQGTWGWEVFYKATEARTSKVSVRWSPQMRESGKYELSAFVPARHTTTRNARYKIHGVTGASGEVLVAVDQFVQRNNWVTLGIFDFEKTAINAGTVYLNDLTGETGAEIAFDAMRWRRVISMPGSGGTGPTPVGFADGYDVPVGTLQERRSDKVWPGQWRDASPFGRLYFVGTPSEAYHTGADLNLPSDGDAHGPVYAAASGTVIFAGRLPVWGNVIIIRHDPLYSTRLVLYSRSAHVESVRVSVGQRVARGEQIANVGNAFGRWAYHLHFDLSPTTILEDNPEHWPGKDRTSLLKHYIDPREFIEANRPK